MEQIKRKLTEDLPEYRPVPLWAWNSTLNVDELKRQINWMNSCGIGGFFMHARSGLGTSYLSEEWMRCVDACCDGADENNMSAWIYDENGWPSGFAGGELLDDIENRDMFIETVYGQFDPNADVSYRITPDKLIRVESGKGEEEYLNLFLKRSASTVDILNPVVVKKFLDSTHERYKKHFGKEFPKRIKGFFTDEPQYYRWNTPFTPMIQAYFKDKYNEDILDNLGLLFEAKEGYRSFRYRYWSAMQRLMLDGYAKMVYDWCDQNGVQLTGHYIEETTLGWQMLCCGGLMPFYEYEHIPGIDWLGLSSNNELPPRQLTSAARQLGKKRQLTETFACCGWNISPADLRRIAGFQFANGVNFLCHHFVPYSEQGHRKRDFPAHFCASNPWVKEHFKEFNDYFTRLGCLLSESEEPVNVAVLHPMRSCYFEYQRNKENDGYGVADIDDALRSACRMLSSRGIGYHFLDETLMEKHGFVKENSIGCGLCSYDYLIIPKILTLGKNTEELIRQYVLNGGKVLLLSDKPAYLEGELHAYEYLKSNCTLSDIVKAQPFTVSNLDTDLYCTYRKRGDTTFLYLQNASKDATFTQTFDFGKEIKSFVALDLVTMSVKELPLTVTLDGNESLLLFLSPKRLNSQKKLSEYELVFHNAEVQTDANWMTLDTVCYSKDGTNYSEPVVCIELFQNLLRERYEGQLWTRYQFEVRTIPNKIHLVAEKGNARSYFINGQEFVFTQMSDDDPSLWIADITQHVRIGENSYTVLQDWHQSEETYHALFGENVTESLLNCIVYDSEIENVYLTGSFGVYSRNAFTDYDEDTVCGHGFYIGAEPKTATDLVTDGFPFFRGKITLKQQVCLPSSDVILKIAGRYQTARVWINGKEVPELIFARKADVSSFAREGENEIKVTFTIGNRNLLGPFHMEGPEDCITPHSFEALDLPKAPGGIPLYRFHRFVD